VGLLDAGNWNAYCQVNGMMSIIRNRTLSVLVFGALLIVCGACMRRVDVRAPNVVRTERFLYVRDDDGRWLIVTSNSKDLDEAMKRIRPGPASVDKLDLWVITPLGPERR
jgi:hypothetical protein